MYQAELDFIENANYIRAEYLKVIFQKQEKELAKEFFEDKEQTYVKS